VTPTIGFGAGGHAKGVIEVLRLIGGFDIVGVLDPNHKLRGTDLLGVPVLGDDDLAADLAARGIRHAFIGVGGVSSTWPRRRLFDLAGEHGFTLVTAIHPSAVLSASATIGPGATIMAGAIVSVSAVLGVNVIVNTGAIVEHDCSIGDHVHVATGVRLAGSVSVGEGAHIGIGAVVRQGIAIGRHAVVGAGAVVIDDVPEGVVVAGVPARVLKRVEESWPI
jgi:sugar O-acyltransferase (sialic acid O-acetyltransferase NeuD family)